MRPSAARDLTNPRRRLGPATAGLAILLALPTALAPPTAATGTCPTGFSLVAGTTNVCQLSFTTSTATWTVPAGVTSIDVIVVGGGGGGGAGHTGGGSGEASNGAGGGGGGVAATAGVLVTAGTPYTVTVGAGGAGSGSTNADGGYGSDSSIIGSGLSLRGAGAAGGASGRSNVTAGGGRSGAGTCTVCTANSYVTTSESWRTGGESHKSYYQGGHGAAGTSVTGGSSAAFGLFRSGSTAVAVGGAGGAGSKGPFAGGLGGTGGGGDGGGNYFPTGIGGTPNTGGGGGGGGTYAFGGNGGSGIVMIRTSTIAAPGPTPTFDSPVRTAGGFTVNVTNYDAAYAWSPTASSGSVSAGTASGTTLPLTVTGLSAGGSSTVTVTTSRSGYSNASASVSGQAKSSQTVTWSPTTSVSTVQSPLTPSTTASALGGAPISYAVVAGFTTSTCSVDASTAQLTYTGTGSCTVRATAAATAAYLSGTTDVTFTVSKATQTVTWSPTATVTTVQSPVTPTGATTNGDGAISYAKISGTTTTCTVDATTGQLTYTGTGNCVVRASAAATDLYSAGSTDVTFTVSKATPALNWSPATAFTVPDGSTTFVAASTDSDGTISYSLTFDTAGCSLTGRTLSFTQVGSCGVTASLAATDTYSAASSVSTFAVSKAAQSVTWAPTSTLTLASLSTTLASATTSGDGGITYSVTSGGGTGCAFANPSSPVLTYASAGACSVTATAATTSGYAQGTQSSTITIALATPTTTWTPVTALTMPAATVNPTAATTTGDGTITYAVTSGSNCSVDANTGALTYTSTGACQVTATSGATSRYAAASSAVTFTVALAPQTITASASSTSLQPGRTATLSSTGSTGTGTITWVQTTGVGVCSLTGTTVTALADGTCTLTVSIAADTTYTAASSTVTITVTTPSSGGGGGSGGSGGASPSGGRPASAVPGSTATAAPAPVSEDAVRPPGTGGSTTGRALPPPPRRVEVSPLRGRSRAKVTVGLPEGAAGASVLSTVVTVRDKSGKIVSRIEIRVRPGQQQTEVVVPYVADGYTVNVYNVNEVGVSIGALDTSPIVHASTITRRTPSGSPTLFGTTVGKPIIFTGGSAALDTTDMRQLRAIAQRAQKSPNRLFITGFARKGGTGTPSELASLSTARAKAVATYLAAQGVRVWIRYWGAGTLNGTGDTNDRRVEIRTSGRPIPRSLVP